MLSLCSDSFRLINSSTIVIQRIQQYKKRMLLSDCNPMAIALLTLNPKPLSPKTPESLH